MQPPHQTSISLIDWSIDAEYPLAGEELAEDGWDYDLDGDGEPDTNWEAENEHDSPSNESSVTLSSKTSKRSFDELERDNEVEDEEDVWSLNSSPQSVYPTDN